MTLKLTEDNSYTIYSEHYDEFYHCKGGALAKARHIFFGPFNETLSQNQQQNYRVLEVGFGTGLNFFVTADAFYNTSSHLEYVALEKNLLNTSTFQSLQYDNHLQNKFLISQFIQDRNKLPQTPKPNHYQFHFKDSIQLSIIIGEALTAQFASNSFDWIYLDPFSPRTNPELWTRSFLEKLYHSLKSGGGLSSYCVKGEIRRILKSIGFEVYKRPGILYKREVLLAKKL